MKAQSTSVALATLGNEKLQAGLVEVHQSGPGLWS